MDGAVFGFCRKCNIGGVIYRDEMCKNCWQQAEIERLRGAIEFALDKCACENAGSGGDGFAYLWRKDWMEFKKMAGVSDGH